MRKKVAALHFLLFIALITFYGADPSMAFGAATTRPASADDVLSYLDRTLDWYHRVNSLEPTSGSSQEMLIRDALHNSSHQAVDTAFVYARAQAELMNHENGGIANVGPQGAQANRIQQSLALVNQKIATFKSELDEINGRIANGAATTRPDLSARRDKIIAELNLVTTRRETLEKFSSFLGSQSNGASSLLDKINDLQKTVPDGFEDQSAPVATAKSAPPASPLVPAVTPAQPQAQQPFTPESAGIFGLISHMFTLTGRMRELSDVEEHTDRLTDETTRLRDPIRANLQSAIKRSDSLASTQQTEDVSLIAGERQQIDQLTERFKELASAAVPLGEENVFLEGTKANLAQWSEMLNRQFRSTLRSLVLRSGAMATVILIVLTVSSLWRRATFRYISDVRRRRQFLVLRRFVVVSIIALVLIVGFVTELGSLATYAGLLTAGIAVALQTVILSGVAYFFVIGRYGIRVGDRVTVGGVSGDVVDVGLFRLYLMELGGNNLDLHPTGRIVVFSNSVLFQTTPFFKQIPGSEYMWHQIALTLSPESDYPLAEKKLMAAVASIYDTYRQEIEREHEAAKHTLHVQLAPPRPEGRLRFVEAGLEFMVRYPVPLQRAAEIDDLVTRKLLKTIEDEPKLRLCVSDAPRIQAAEPPRGAAA